MNAKGWLVAGSLLSALPLISACDPYPVVDVQNGTTSTLALRWKVQPSSSEETYPKIAEPSRKARMWASTMFEEDNLVIAAMGCDYIYPKVPPAIQYGYGRVNNLLVTPDMRLNLYGVGDFLDVRTRRAEKQPPGWPVSPISRTCR